MSLDLTYDKSTLVQVMALCSQATSHQLSQCWPRSMSPYGITRPQWVNCFILGSVNPFVQLPVYYGTIYYKCMLMHILCPRSMDWNSSLLLVISLWWPECQPIHDQHFKFEFCIQIRNWINQIGFCNIPAFSFRHGNVYNLCLCNDRGCFLSVAWSKHRLCSANHRPGHWSNLPWDWPSTAWAYSE